MKQKNILICVTGLTPQIVTETFFCLSVKEKIPISEIYVLTTAKGREVILGTDKAEQTPKTSLKKELKDLCKKYKIKQPSFENIDNHIIVAKEEAIELPDIRSDKDNILFPNKISSFIREKTKNPENILYCSITGGRKSMSVHLANALALFGRENDKILHVLTKEENEFQGFFPKTKKEERDLELSEIPYVRLRALLSTDVKNKKLLDQKFNEIVAFAQKQIKILSEQNHFFIDMRRRELSYNNNTITLEPIEFLFYYYFIDMKSKGEAKLSIHEITAPETSKKFVSYLEQYFPHYYLRESQKKSWAKGFGAADFRTKRSNINKKIRELIEDEDITNQFIIEVEKMYADSHYFIPAQMNRFKVSVTN